MTDRQAEHTPFFYLMNRMEAAAQAKNPATEGYAAKRKAVFDHVNTLRRQLDMLAETLRGFSVWREKAMAYDTDMGHIDQRIFCEDIELIEDAARAARAEVAKLHASKP